MKKYGLFLFTALFLNICGCQTIRNITPSVNSIGKLRFIGKYIVPHHFSFENTIVGGLSGIDYDTARQQYYLISDDRSVYNPARYYSAQLFFSDNSFDSVKFTAVTTLLTPNGNAYPSSKINSTLTPDPEAMRYNAKKGGLVWSSEGERIVNASDTVLINPGIYEINLSGRYLDSFALPAQFRMQATDNGPRRNGVFEGLAFTPDYKYLYASLEEPRYEDGPQAGIRDTSAYTRIIKYDNYTRQPVAQFAYKLEPVAHSSIPENAFKVNGISDILVLADQQLLTIERSFSTGVKDCTIKVFITDLNKASDISHISSLQKNIHFKPAVKSLLYDFKSLNSYIDNVEGVTYGPVLPNGHRTLVFVTDNNFATNEESQFFIFEVVPTY